MESRRVISESVECETLYHDACSHSHLIIVTDAI